MNLNPTYEELAAILEIAETVRVTFRDGDIYDLKSISVAQDLDEQDPHASAIVVTPHQQCVRVRRSFGRGAAMFFILRDVQRVEDVETSRVLFQAA